MEKEVRQSKLSLASLPEVAIRVRDACSDEESSLDDIADMISRDNSISLKLLQAANSPLYRGEAEIKTVRNAVSRLGKQITQHLVFYFAAKEVFKSPLKALDSAFRQCWDDSLNRAVMARTIAALSNRRFNPDIAFLCGLLFRAGDLIILQYISSHIEDQGELGKIRYVSEEESAANTQLVVAQWNLPKAVTAVLKKGGSWTYQSKQRGG